MNYGDLVLLAFIAVGLVWIIGWVCYGILGEHAHRQRMTAIWARYNDSL